MPADEATKVAYGTVGEAAASFQRSRTSTLPFAEVVTRLRAAIERADLWVLDEVDAQTIVGRGGYVIEATRMILFFHPRLMARVLAADPAALLEAPLKLAVLEEPGGAVIVRWFDSVAPYARYGNPDLAALGKELATICEEIVTAIAH